MSNECGDLPKFEFDEAKNRSNKLTHGIDFVEAQGLGRRSRFEEVAIYESQRL